jgi:hypothetical protein
MPALRSLRPRGHVCGFCGVALTGAATLLRTSSWQGQRGARRDCAREQRHHDVAAGLYPLVHHAVAPGFATPGGASTRGTPPCSPAAPASVGRGAGRVVRLSRQRPPAALRSAGTDTCLPARPPPASPQATTSSQSPPRAPPRTTCTGTSCSCLPRLRYDDGI